MEHLFDNKEEQFDTIDLNISFENEVYQQEVLTDKLELFLQEIYLALMIAPNEIWGISDSIDLQKYLFNTYITTDFINAEITKFISIHCEHSQYYYYTIKSNIEMDENNNEFISIILNIETESGSVLKSFLLG